MKVLKEVGKAARQLVEDVTKRKGLYVARPVLNGDAWEKWAKANNIPNPVPAGEMHVTVLYSATDVKKPKHEDVISIGTSRAAFAMMGPTDQVLAVLIPAWQLQDRNWEFTMAGAVETWPTYKPHMTISYDATGFEISDEAMSSMPPSVILGAEVYGALNEKVNFEMAAEADAGDVSGDMVIVVNEIYCSAAKSLLEAGGELSLLDEMALRDVATRKSVYASHLEVVKSLKPDLPTEAVANVRKMVEKDIVITMKPFEGDIAKHMDGGVSTDDDRHLVWGIANVATIGGVPVEDLDEDTFTVRALEEFTIDLMKNQRAGKFEHEGEVVNTVVQALVLSEDLQKALGFDLGYEPLIICTEVPDPAAWAEVKKGKWMHSIAGVFTYFEDDQANA